MGSLTSQKAFWPSGLSFPARQALSANISQYPAPEPTVPTVTAPGSDSKSELDHATDAVSQKDQSH